MKGFMQKLGVEEERDFPNQRWVDKKYDIDMTWKHILHYWPCVKEINWCNNILLELKMLGIGGLLSISLN